MRLEWSRFALEDRFQIFDYVEVDNPRAAVTIDERIQAQVDALPSSLRWAATGELKGRAS